MPYSQHPDVSVKEEKKNEQHETPNSADPIAKYK